MPKQRYRMVIVKAARRRAIVPDGQNTSECFRDLRKLGLGPQWDVRCAALRHGRRPGKLVLA